MICNPSTLAENLPILSERLSEQPDGTFGMDFSLGEQLTDVKSGSAAIGCKTKSGDESKDGFSDISGKKGLSGKVGGAGSGKDGSDKSYDCRGSKHASFPNPAFNGLDSPVKESVSAVHFASPSSKKSTFEVDMALASGGSSREGRSSPRSLKEE